MDFVEEINNLVCELKHGGEEIAPFVSVSTNVYASLQKSMSLRMHNPYAISGFTAIAVSTAYCTVDVRCDPSKPADYVGMNGRTLLDIIVERELLGDE